jgi:hypothetical protein
VTARATPGLGGYALVHLLCSLFVWGPLAFAALLSPGGDPHAGLLSAIVALLVGTVAAVIYGAPAAIAGGLLLHICLRRVPEQWVHVLAFGLAGAAVGVLYDRVIFNGFYDDLWISLAVAAAAARACVIPMTRSAA